MKKLALFSSELSTHLLQELAAIAKSSENILQTAEKSAKAAREILLKLNEFIREYEFADQQEEIRFFKKIKPAILKELIYHREVYSVEALLPVGKKQSVLNHYKQQMERVELYCRKNRELFNYYKLGSDYRDPTYFVRDAIQPDDNILNDPVEIDRSICTKYSYVLSRLQAFEMLHEYLQKAIYNIDNPVFNADGGELKFANRWTDSIVALIELVYALHARGSINNGKGSIKQIMQDFERVFNIDTGNFHRTFQNMRIRKKDATPFLNALSEALKYKIDEY